MPIRAEQQHFYPIDWPQLSHAIRFGRAGGVCERCGRQHGRDVWHLGEAMIDGRTGLWWDADRLIWRCGAGRRAALPGLETVWHEALRQGVLWPGREPDEDRVLREGLSRMRVVLACCHLDHDPANNAPRNLAALCQRCHLKHDAADNLARRRAGNRGRRTHGMETFGF